MIPAANRLEKWIQMSSLMVRGTIEPPMQNKEGHIIIVDDDPEVLLSAEMLLENYFKTVTTLPQPAGVEDILRQETVDVVLLDMNFTRGTSDGGEGLGWLERISTLAPQTSVVMITAYGDTDLAVKAIKRGAFDFILKPWKNAKLLATSLSAYKYAASVKQNQKLKSTQQTLQDDSNQEFDRLVGSAPAMRQLKGTIERVAPTQAHVLILGENGTGKELVARHIHRQSNRNQNIFLPVDLGALSDSLFESELFGHVRGAFTDAREDKPGRFELASGGTIFLDEIGNLPFPLQSKLLAVLQKQQTNRVGSARMIPVDFRLITATNCSLNEMIQYGTFRQDLYYRINTFEITIPPLRERKEDIPELAAYLLERLSKKYGKPGLKPSPRMMQQLKRHDWPGNIRELMHTLERAVIFSDNTTPDLRQVQLSSHYSPKAKENLDLEENEKRLIMKALQKNNGNITRAARDLGLKRNALYRRLNKYGLQ